MDGKHGQLGARVNRKCIRGKGHGCMVMQTSGLQGEDRVMKISGFYFYFPVRRACSCAARFLSISLFALFLTSFLRSMPTDIKRSVARVQH